MALGAIRSNGLNPHLSGKESMPIRTSTFTHAVTCAALLFACGGSDEPGSGTTEWLGEDTHFAVSGTFQGTTFDVLLEGEAASSIYCNRFYAPLPGEMPDAEGNYGGDQVYFAMKEIGAIFDVNGEPKEFTVAYWRHDMGAGTELEIVPRNFGDVIPAGKTWSDINIFDPGTNILSGVESAASSGVVKLELNTGSPDASGVMIPSGGRTGEFVSMSWGPREALQISATADCNTLVVEWAQDLVAP